MRFTTASQLKGLTVLFILFGLNACQKDNKEVLKQQPMQALNIETVSGDIVDIDESTLRAPNPNALKTRLADVGDIEDVIVPPAGSAAATDSCDKVCPTFPGVFDCAILCHLIRLSKPWEIKAGQRFGVKTPEDVCQVPTIGSAFSCYEINNQTLCGYGGKEKAFPLTINTAGNYRVQVTSKSPTKDFDLFVFLKEGSGTQQQTSDVKKLETCSTFPAGKTETVHLTKKGRYHLMIDEYTNNANCSEGEFTIAVSANTNVLTLPTRKGNHLIYQFKVLKEPTENQLVAWALRVVHNGAVSEPRYYRSNSRFSFNCQQFDYLVTPVYRHSVTNQIVEGDATLIHP